MSYDTLTNEILKMVQDIIAPAPDILTGEVYRDGIMNVLTEPEFAQSESARKALRVLEERPFLEELLAQTVMGTEVGTVQVLIGGEGNWEELSECTVVLARYGIPNMVTGALGVLGPIRMRYGRTISTVRFVANLLSEWVQETHTE
jgi:heat-inducible transcriptional repressor